MKKINKKENIFEDEIAFVEQYDFSTANMSEENRILAVTQIASICYQNPKNVGSESLYNRLMTEAHSLPSSSAEFVPMLFNYEWICNYIANYSDVFIDKTNILKYGEIITHNGEEYLLTNFRALVYDVEKIGLNKEILKQYNTEEECEIIKQYFKVFKYNVDLPTRSQMVRHRVSWQELCISGESKITTSQGTRTIKELYEIQERQKSKYSDVKYPSIKCYDEDKGLFVKAKIKEVFYTGKKEVLEAKIQFGSEGKNRIIKSTKDHKFLTKSGWKALEDIAIGEYVAINGKPLYQDYDWLKLQKETFLKKGIGMKGMAVELGINYNTLKAWIHKHNLHYTQKETSSTYTVWNKDIKGEDSHSYGRVLDNTVREKISKKLAKELGHTKGGHRSRYSSYWEADFRKTPLLDKFGYKCAKCDCKENLEVDHIKPCFSHPELAFDEDNVQILCKECHREKSIEDAVLSKQTIKFGMLISKDLVGIEDTYDMEIDHKSHNYVANKILVHNSRRYVSGSRVPFEFYVSEKMKDVVTSNYFDQKIGDNIYRKEIETEFDIEDLINISLTFYKEAIKQGIKPQEARRIIPQAAYTQIWGAFQPKQLENYFKLRLDESSQWEIRMVSKAMQELINGRK